ncbi:MAG: 2-amino-4-hydroxy-6-hydroxymethyldihydropteridine diphosphokinase [Calditrichaeota bacterium]|nr:2-amino-4-hydroxy-6-hydroxymethyldihydropteridine diphosphokinase [Calditrichota bacterium]
MVYLSLGSNLGDRFNFLQQGIDGLRDVAVDRQIQRSKIYETEPWGNIAQPNFLNCVVEFDYRGTPEALLSEIHEIETGTGRIRGSDSTVTQWMARTLDLDILVFNDVCINSEKLTIPHKLMTQRHFVLVPLAEIAPDLIIPGYLKSVRQCVDECQDICGLKIWKQ